MIDAYCINLREREDKWSSFVAQNIPIDVKRFDAIKNDNGSIGCRLSHIEVMKLCKEEILIFEDDCKLLREWIYFNYAYSQLPSNWHVLYLGANLHKPLKRYSESLYHLTDAWATHGILYKKEVVDKILSDGESVISKDKNIDNYLVRYIQNKFNCFIIYPFFATQAKGYSDVIKEMRDCADMESNFYKNTEWIVF